MNNECRIKDEDEIMEEEKNRFNFRRFKPEELDKKYSPFERNKKEFPFLFQKNKRETVQKEDHKISLEEIISKVKDLSFNSPTLYSPHTPQYPPWDLSGNIIMPSLDLNDISGNLNMSQPMELDG